MVAGTLRVPWQIYLRYAFCNISRHSECAYYLVTALGVCLLPLLRHTEYAYYLVTAHGVCLLPLLRHSECAYYLCYGTRSVPTTFVTAHGVCLLPFCYGTRSVPTTFVTAHGVCLLPLLRHTECAYYFGQRNGCCVDPDNVVDVGRVATCHRYR